MAKQLESRMEFFRTTEGRVHTGRIAGLLYLLVAVLGCRNFLVLEPLCVEKVAFAAGWWLCFAGNRPARTLSEMANPRGILGTVLLLLGIAGQVMLVMLGCGR
jgi:hypothetical protein